MTEREAIEALKLINTSRVHPFYSWEEMCDVRDIAIKALEEIRQYREMGTLEELKTASRYIHLAKRHETTGEVIDKCVEYEEIGTVEEFRKAKIFKPKLFTEQYLN